MSKIKELQAKRVQLVDQLDAINKKALDESRDLTEVEQEAYDTIKAEIVGHDKTIARLTEAEQFRASLAKPVDDKPEDKSAPADSFADRMQGLKLFYGDFSQKPAAQKSTSDFGAFVCSLIATKGIAPLAAAHAYTHFGNEKVAKALSTSTSAGDGGNIVPTEFSTEFIELLRAAAVVRQANPSRMTFPGGFGTIQLPAAATGVTAGWVGENNPIGYGQMTFAPVTLTPRKLAALTAVSNELIRRSAPSVDSIVRDDLVRSVAVVEDATFLTSSASSSTTPIGLKGIAGTKHFAMTGTGTLAEVTTDLDNAVLKLKNLNSALTRGAWFMSPRSESYLMSLRDGNGNFAFRPEMLTGRLFRYPYFTTTSIADNGGTATNQSTVYFADMMDMIVAEELAIVVDVSSEASYSTDGTAGNMVSSFQSDQTVVRVIETVDFVGRRPMASYISAVTWGA